jgi:hypothetical protein
VVGEEEQVQVVEILERMGYLAVLAAVVRLMV